MNRSVLSASEISSALAGLPGWVLDGDKITKTYEFKSYASGVIFAAGVGHMADQMDHHPDLFIGYQKVQVGLSTHDPAGITALDIALAGKIERLFSGDS